MSFLTPLVNALLALPPGLALLAVFLLPMLESSAFLGFIFPGELVVVLGGVVASQGHLPVAAVGLAAIFGCVLGDAIGYFVGRRWGRRLVDSSLGRFVNREHIERAERALRRHGGWAVLLGRFTVALRVMVPGLAGMSGLSYRRFAVANVVGGVLWASVMVAAGYLAGNSWHTVERAVSATGLGITAAVVAVLLGARWVARRRVARNAAGGVDQGRVDQGRADEGSADRAPEPAGARR